MEPPHTPRVPREVGQFIYHPDVFRRKPTPAEWDHFSNTCTQALIRLVKETQEASRPFTVAVLRCRGIRRSDVTAPLPRRGLRSVRLFVRDDSDKQIDLEEVLSKLRPRV